VEKEIKGGKMVEQIFVNLSVKEFIHLCPQRFFSTVISLKERTNRSSYGAAICPS